MSKKFSAYSAVLLLVLLGLQGCGGSSGGGGVTQNSEDPNEKPAILGAISISNTTVLISFNKTMAASAIDPANYVITQENVNPEVGTVLITGAKFLVDDHHGVVLQTSAQNEVTYRVKVVNVKDVNGNMLSGKSVGADGSVIDPSSSLFAGTAPGLVSVTFDGTSWDDNNHNGVVDVGDSIVDANGVHIVLVDDNMDGVVDNWTDTDASGTVNAGDVIAGLRDTDGDGLPDNVELSGTLVYVDLSNGQSTTRQVTSDPTKADTDGDGLSDLEEWNIGTDPRNRDTDTDGLSDYTEYNIINSSPIAQDTDQDGITDGLEYSVYHTSPLLADTDGDKLDDGEELFQLNRNPLVADLPEIAIEVGDVRLQIDERYTYTDETGKTVSQESSTNATLSQSQDYSHSSGSSTADQIAVGLSIGGSFERQNKTGGVTSESYIQNTYTFNADVHSDFTHSWSSQVDDTSAQGAQQAYENSLSKGSQYSTTSTVTREVVGARIDVDLNVKNVGNVPFSVSNLEITVLEPSPVDTGKFVPVATLVSNSELVTGTPLVVNLGPFNSQRGPFIFANREVFPNLVEALMRNPRGLIFRVANYDITDELGRNFAFSEQLARDRTASITLDEGDAAAAETHLVAASGALDTDGFAGGNGTAYVGGFNTDGTPKGLPLDYLLQARLGLKKHDTSKDVIVPGQNGVLNSTIAGDDVIDANGNISTGPNGWLETSPVGDDYVANPTVQDGIVAGLNKTADSIAQGDDIQLVPVGTTGLSVGTVVIGAGENGTLDTPALVDDKPEFVTGYETQRTCAATSTKNAGNLCRIDDDCRTTPTDLGSCSGPQRLVRVNSLRDGDYGRNWFVLTDGVVPAAANFGDIVVKPGKNLTLAFLQDLDTDGVFARTEYLYGTIDSAEDKLDNSKFGVSFDENAPVTCPSMNPGACDGKADSKDTDRDGIGDYAEINVGWKVASDGGSLHRVYSNPRLRDSDGDGLQDLEEQDLSSYCVAGDTRTDGLCAFTSQLTSVTKAQAIAIIAGHDGLAQSIAGDTNGDGLVDSNDGPSDDIQVMLLSDPAGKSIATVIDPGLDGIIQTALRGDDLYVSSTFVWPATDPSSKDTDLDGVNDYDEIKGYDVGLAIVDGGDGIVNIGFNGDDVQKVPFGNPVMPGGAIILPGVNGVIDTNPPVVGDDIYYGGLIFCGLNLKADTLAMGDDVQWTAPDASCASSADLVINVGTNGVLDTTPNNYHSELLRPSHIVTTDPLRRDTDNDTNADGLEILLGSDPTIADAADFRDSDRDGLTDNEESSLGWNVTVNGNTPYTVKSSPSLIDTDGDGLPDLIERDLRTDPNKVDTDGDGISDFDEVNDFARFVRLMAAYPAVVINGSASASYGTNPLMADTDGDGLSDHQELIDGFYLTLPGDTTPRHIFTSPVQLDTDGDGLTDAEEVNIHHTDPTNNDTDGDGQTDGREIAIGSDPLVPDVAVKLTIERVNATKITGDGANGTAEMTWWFTTKGPGETYPTLLTDPRNALPAVWQNYIFASTNTCIGYPMLSGTTYDLNVVNSNRTFILQPGQSFQLNGLIGEMDDVSNDCDKPPYYTPSSIWDAQGCTVNVNKVITYNDALGYSGAQLLTATASNQSCSIDIQYTIERQ